MVTEKTQVTEADLAQSERKQQSWQPYEAGEIASSPDHLIAGDGEGVPANQIASGQAGRRRHRKRPATERLDDESKRSQFFGFAEKNPGVQAPKTLSHKPEPETRRKSGTPGSE
jgi:hypothetical protein